MTTAQLFAQGFFCNRGLWIACLRGVIGLAALGIVLALGMAIDRDYGLWIFLGLFAVIFIPAVLWMKRIGLSEKIRTSLAEAINRPAPAERLGSLIFFAMSQGTLWGVGVHALLFLYISFFPSYGYASPAQPGYWETLLMTILYGQLLGVLFMTGFIKTNKIRWALYGALGVAFVGMMFGT